jgi:hypothetical protein
MLQVSPGCTEQCGLSVGAVIYRWLYEHVGYSESMSRAAKVWDSGFEAMNLGTTLYWMRKHFSNYAESRLFLTGFMTNKV